MRNKCVENSGKSSRSSRFNITDSYCGSNHVRSVNIFCLSVCKKWTVTSCTWYRTSISWYHTHVPYDRRCAWLVEGRTPRSVGTWWEVSRNRCEIFHLFLLVEDVYFEFDCYIAMKILLLRKGNDYDSLKLIMHLFGSDLLFTSFSSL